MMLHYQSHKTWSTGASASRRTVHFARTGPAPFSPARRPRAAERSHALDATHSPPLRRPLAAPCASSTSDTAVASTLQEFICSGPLLGVCGLSPEAVEEELVTWQKLGMQLAEQLGFDHDNMDDIQRLRIYRYYLPIYFWLQQQLQQHKTKHAGTTAPPLILGISAPQGCGKTTIVEQLQELLTWLGLRVASVSIDDFYLRRKDQAELAAANPSNQLLQVRGNAGTHDLELGTKVLQQLQQLTKEGDKVAVPRYDKSAFQGLGDRADESTWPTVEGPLDLLLFEGWMLGFSPVAPEAAAAVEESVVQVNEALKAYREAWDSFVDAWLVVKIQDPQVVFGWRLQAEHAMRASGKPGMTDEQVADFVSRYIPAYTAYLPGLYASGPTTAKPGHCLVIEVDSSRSPVEKQPEALM